VSELWDDAPDDLPAGRLGPVFVAGLETDCESCPDPIVPGEDARADGHGGWIHADDQCERVARAEDNATASAACPDCFTVHAGECA
jgi:hypothetical protein